MRHDVSFVFQYFNCMAQPSILCFGYDSQLLEDDKTSNAGRQAGCEIDHVKRTSSASYSLAFALSSWLSASFLLVLRPSVPMVMSSAPVARPAAMLKARGRGLSAKLGALGRCFPLALPPTTGSSYIADRQI
jgi:hypothetical protein